MRVLEVHRGSEKKKKVLLMLIRLEECTKPSLNCLDSSDPHLDRQRIIFTLSSSGQQWRSLQRMETGSHCSAKGTLIPIYSLLKIMLKKCFWKVLTLAIWNVVWEVHVRKDKHHPRVENVLYRGMGYSFSRPMCMTDQQPDQMYEPYI